MYLGKPVISTDWSGTAEFVNEANGCPVRCSLVTLDRNHGPYAKGQTWAAPDIDHAAQWMQRLARDHALGQRLGACRPHDHRGEIFSRRHRRALPAAARGHRRLVRATFVSPDVCPAPYRWPNKFCGSAPSGGGRLHRYPPNGLQFAPFSLRVPARFLALYYLAPRSLRNPVALFASLVFYVWVSRCSPAGWSVRACLIFF